LTEKQKSELRKGLISRDDIFIRPTKTQSGGFLGGFLASIDIPLGVDMIGKPLLKVITKKGAPRLGLPKSRGGSAP